MSKKTTESQTHGYALFSTNFTWAAWKGFFKDLLQNVHNDNVVIVSGGVAFFFFLALFPALTGIISVYGLLADPGEIQQQLVKLASIFPMEAEEFITQRLTKMINEPGQGKGWKLAISIILSVWIANIGTRALFKGVNIAYRAEHKRNFFRENGFTLLFTAGGIVFNILIIAFLVGFPTLAAELGFKDLYKFVLKWLQWPVFAVLIGGAVGLVYHFARYKKRSKFKWVMPGAISVGLLWVIGSWVLSFMLRTVGIFSQPYGSSLAIIFLMLWCLLISFIILLGAEINSIVEGKRGNSPE